MAEEQQHLACYLCGRDNRIPKTFSSTSSLRCGACEALLVTLITCSTCGTKNRVRVRFVEHHPVTCGKCRSHLDTSQFEVRLKKRSASKQILCNALRIKGKQHQWSGHWETAIQLFRQAQKCDTFTSADITKLSVSISLCHVYLGHVEYAAAILAQLDISGLQEFAVTYELARAYGLLEQPEKSLLYFQKARNAVTDLDLAKHLDDLIDQLCVLCEAEDASPAIGTSILLYDAMRDYENHNIQAGVQKLSLAREIDPDNPNIAQQLGLGLLQQDKFDQAVEMLERGLEFHPSDEQAQFALGDAYFHLGLYECALNAYKQTLHLNPRNIDAYHHLGLVYEQQGEVEFAKGYWEDILKVNPLHQDALTCLSRHKN